MGRHESCAAPRRGAGRRRSCTWRRAVLRGRLGVHSWVQVGQRLCKENAYAMAADGLAAAIAIGEAESLFGDVAHLLVRWESAIAVGVRRSVATLQPDLVHPQAAELLAVREKVLVDAQPAVKIRVELGHPRADTVGVELVVPCPVQRVGEV